MKTFGIIAKIVAALLAVAGAVYVIATYGDKIVAWAKGLIPCKCGEAEPVEEGGEEVVEAVEGGEEVVEGGEEVVADRHYTAKILFYYVGIFLYGLAKRTKKYAFFCQSIGECGLYRYTVHNGINCHSA